MHKFSAIKLFAYTLIIISLSACSMNKMMVSASLPMIESGIEAMKLGAEDFLEKPVDLDVLMEKIKKATYNKMLLVEKGRQEEVKKIMKKKGW